MKRPLLHPLVLGSLLVLVVNDHVLKRVHPSFLTGKLSDIAGVFLLPFVFVAAFELFASKTRGRIPSARARNGALVISVAFTMVGFALVELSPIAEAIYRYGLGALQWPFWAAVAVLGGDPLPAIAPVRATADPTDLLALPMGFLALFVGWQGPRSERRLRSRLAAPTAAGLSLLSVLALAPATASAAPADTQDCYAKGAYTHNGFFLSGGLAIGALFVDSEESISNGFQQPLPSSANGLLFPMIDLSIGGTLPDPLLVIGARYVRGDALNPVVHTLDESFAIPDFRIGFGELSLFGRYYIDPHVGTHVGGSVGFFSMWAGETQEVLTDDSYGGSATLNGIGLTAEGGQDLWILKDVSVGLTLRLAFARLSHDSNTTLVFAPTLLGSLVYH